MRFIAENFEQVCDYPLTELKKSELRSILKEDSLGVHEEAVALSGALKWIEETSASKHSTEAVLAHVRLGLLPYQTLREFEESEWVQRSVVLRSMVHAAYKYRAAPSDMRAGISNPQCTHRERTYSFV
eukprot:TRINITY_DN18264_c0_g1_i5.p1 TRINITY_DN18264_c0_g1~~TRINITY_DN18264_c0_g1_i5.p1  ORF type:complete len:128 (-),score=22.80 TRINITY_DN18264_c0_g1_i5:45-428(-)